MQTRLLAAVLLSAGICASQAADLIEDSIPYVEMEELRLSIHIPLSDRFLAMNLRLYDQQGQLVFNARSLGESVEIPTMDLADGEYRYESVSIIATDDPEEPEIAKRNFGSFKVKNGEIQPEQVPFGEELTQAIQHGLGTALSWLIPSAQADVLATLQIENTTPFIAFDDLANGQGTDWQLNGYTGSYGIFDNKTGAYTFSVVRSDNNANSIEVDSAGDIHLGNSAMVIDRSATRIGIGTSNPGYELDIHDSTPEIEFYDETNGSIAHIQYNSPIFTIEGNNSQQDIFKINTDAPADSFVVNDSGNIGIGTDSPNQKLHIRSETGIPRIMFEYDNPGQPQWFWSMGAFDSKFTLTDLTGSSTVFEIFSGAKLVTINPTGMAIGDGSATATLDVSDFDGSTKLLVDERSTSSAARTLFELRNRGNTKFSINNIDAGEEWAFANPGTGFRISRQGSGVVEFDLLNNGNLTIAGTLTENSDRNAKTNIVAIDAQEVLQKVASLPIQQWQYKDALGENHIGPMAQDFYAAFGLGATDKGIATLDSAGVALASIQALAKQNQQILQQNAELVSRSQRIEQENSTLRAENASFKAKLTRIEQQQQRLLQMEETIELLKQQTTPLYSSLNNEK